MNLMFNTVVNIKVCLLKYHLEPHLFKLTPKTRIFTTIKSPQRTFPKERYFIGRSRI